MIVEGSNDGGEGREEGEGGGLYTHLEAHAR